MALSRERATRILRRARENTSSVTRRRVTGNVTVPAHVFSAMIRICSGSGEIGDRCLFEKYMDFCDDGSSAQMPYEAPNAG